MRRKDGTNVWVERVVKVFKYQTPKSYVDANGTLAIGNDMNDMNGDSTHNDLLALVAPSQYSEESELLYTTRSIFYICSSLILFYSVNTYRKGKTWRSSSEELRSCKLQPQLPLKLNVTSLPLLVTNAATPSMHYSILRIS